MSSTLPERAPGKSYRREILEHCGDEWEEWWLLPQFPRFDKVYFRMNLQYITLIIRRLYTKRIKKVVFTYHKVDVISNSKLFGHFPTDLCINK